MVKGREIGEVSTQMSTKQSFQYFVMKVNFWRTVDRANRLVAIRDCGVFRARGSGPKVSLRSRVANSDKLCK